MIDPTQLPLEDRLRAIVAFLPAFQQCDEQNLSAFVQVAYDYGWVRPMDWSKWYQTPEARSLRDDASVLAQATDDQLVCLLTTCIRQDRFFEGVLEAHYQSGLLRRILERAASLLQDLPSQAGAKDD